MQDQHEYNDGLLWYTNEDGIITIGITEVALKELGSVIGIDLPETEGSFSRGDWIGEIEGREGTVEIAAPLAFEITEVNGEIKSDPSLLEDDATGDAWLIRGKPSLDS